VSVQGFDAWGPREEKVVHDVGEDRRRGPDGGPPRTLH
jgi:hypothetical protein